MLIIFGSNGYMGSAIANECSKRGVSWTAGRRDGILKVMHQIADCDADLAINAAAFIPMPSVDACKNDPDATIAGNVCWPGVLRDACEVKGIPIMHLSTGCLFDEQLEYTETDKPTRGYAGYCGFYVGTKLLAERVVSHYEQHHIQQHYILRLRLPFDEVDHPRNYLTKLKSFDRVFEHVNSLTHRRDFAKWALDLWQKRAPYGTYHCVNSEQISATGLVLNMASLGLVPKMPEFVKSPDTTGARLSCEKLVAAGVPVRSVHDALAESLTNWKPSK